MFYLSIGKFVNQLLCVYMNWNDIHIHIQVVRNKLDLAYKNYSKVVVVESVDPGICVEGCSEVVTA